MWKENVQHAKLFGAKIQLVYKTKCSKYMYCAYNMWKENVQHAKLFRSNYAIYRESMIGRDLG